MSEATGYPRGSSNLALVKDLTAMVLMVAVGTEHLALVQLLTDLLVRVTLGHGLGLLAGIDVVKA